MNCDEYRQQSILSEREASLPADVRLHFAVCPDCQNYLSEQERLRIEIGRLADCEQAPESLRRSITQIARQRSQGEPLYIRRWLATAAAITLLSGSGATLIHYYRLRSPSPEGLTQAFVNDDLRYIPAAREQIISNAPKQVESWLQEHVQFPMRVPQVPDASLHDARICHIFGRKAALLHYRRDTGGGLVSLFVTKEPKTFEREGESVSLVTSIRGLNSNLWCHHGLVYDVVAAVDDEALRQISESVQKQAP